MDTYRITNSTSGQDFGFYRGDSPEEALDSLAQDAGYRDHAEAVAVAGEADLAVERVCFEAVVETGSQSGPDDMYSAVRREVAVRCGHEHKSFATAERCRQHLRADGRSARWYNSTIHYARTGIRAEREE